MNETNANRIKLHLPPVIANIIGDRSMIKRTIGRSGNSVYAVGKDLYLKVSPHIEDLRRERDTDIWLEGKLPGGISIPRVGAYDEVIHPISGEMLGYLLTSSVSGTPASSPPYIKDPTRLCNLLADAVRIFHELSPEGCPAPADKLRPGDVVIHGDFCTLLEVAQHHHTNQVAYVKRIGSGIYSQICTCELFLQLLLCSRRHVLNHATPFKFLYEIHRLYLFLLIFNSILCAVLT